MENDREKLEAMDLTELLNYCSKLGIKVTLGSQKEDIVEAILETIEDLNTFMEAKSNVKKDMKATGKILKENAGKVFCGYCVKTGEAIYR